MKQVQVHLYSQSEPCVYDNVVNTYQKGDMFCVLKEDGDVLKHPMQHIFRVRERGLAVKDAPLGPNTGMNSRTGKPIVAPAFSEIKVEGNKVFTKPGKFATFYEAMHDLVSRWETENWTEPTFKFYFQELCAEWY